MKMKLALSAAALCAAQAASATTMDLTYVGAAAGYRNVTLNAVPVAVVDGLTHVSAGGFSMNDASLGGLGSFVAWCLDLGAYLGTSGSHEYETTSTPFQNGGVSLSPNGLSRISSMFSANFGDGITANANSSAAFQLALWETVYDDDMNIATGSFRASSTAAVQSLAASYLAAASAYTGPNLWDLSYLESTAANRSQNLVTATLAAVPVPASGLLLLFALGGFAAARRRKTA